MSALIPILLALLIFPEIQGQFHLRSPEDVVLQAAGSDAILPCSLSAPAIPVSLSLRWFLLRGWERREILSFRGGNGTENPGKGYEGRATISADLVRVGNLSLKLRNLRVWDKGKYVCRVEYCRWNAEAFVELDVIAPFRSFPVSSPVVGMVGRDVLLPCLFSPDPTGNSAGNFTVRWELLGSSELIHEFSRDGGITSQRRGRNFLGRTELFPAGINHGNASLVLRNIRNSDRNSYVCALESESWNDESVLELEVTGQFQILAPSSPIVTSIGNDAVLPCRLSPSVNPGIVTAHWVALDPSGIPREISSGRTIRDSWREQRNWGGTELLPEDFSIKLRNVQIPDGGKYLCQVTAGMWRDQAVVELEVTATIPRILPSSYLARAAGSRVLLDCPLPATVLPEFSLEWLLSRPSGMIPIVSYDGKRFGKRKFQGQKELLHWAPSRGVSSLLLENIQDSDAGIYICRVFSGKRLHEAAFELDVV